MKHFRIKNLFLAPALLLNLLCSMSLVHGESCHVAFVYDGDTILLRNDTKIRYIGIDTPEIDHENGHDELFAREARDLNRELIGRKAITLEYDRQTKDRYKRTLAYVFIENGEMVNALMVKSGIAYVVTHRPNLRYRSTLIHAQRQAMQEKTGIWKNSSIEEKTEYRGNRKSFRFHRMDCPSGRQISMNNRISFSSMYEAFWKGYSPCHRCLPKWFEKSASTNFNPNISLQENRERPTEAPPPALLPQNSEQTK